MHFGAEPEGVLRARYDRFDCRDVKNTPLQVGPTRIDVIDQPDGHEVLVEYRRGYDSMVVDNSFVDHESRVFQVSLKSDDGRPYLRQYRIPQSHAPGELAITDDWEHHRTKSGFIGKFRRTLLRCTLT